MAKKLSTHFTESEMIRTSHRTFDNNPSPHVIQNLRTLCVDYLEVVRSVFGPLWITSGFRCFELNAAIGGSSTSAHVHGCAADFVPMHAVDTQDIVLWLISGSGLNYDQVIDEYSSTANWIHLGIAIPSSGRQPRRQALTMRNGVYSPFVHGR